MSQRPSHIRVRGARTHNLRGLDLDLPREQLVVITGPSGSGKSSLAFDTIFAEGERRYVESLSVSARQFLSQLPRPDVDLVDGLSPTVALEQRNRARGPRSTVGTVTEVYDFLRLLFARVGQVCSPETGEPAHRHSVQDMADAILDLPHRTKFSVLAPVVVAEPGDHVETIESLRRGGFVRVAIDDELRDLDEDIHLDPERRHTIEVYVDRLVRKDGIEARLGDSLEVAVGLSGGLVKIQPLDADDLLFSTRFRDASGRELDLPEPTPRLFSFNAPEGACPTCDGLGTVERFDPELVVPDPERSLAEGAIEPWAAGRGAAAHRKRLEALAGHLGFDLRTPWARLSPEVRLAVLEGTGREVVLGIGRKPQPFEGALAWLRRRLDELSRKQEGEGKGARTELEPARYLNRRPCPDCGGERLVAAARAVRVGPWRLPELARLPLDELAEALAGIELDEESRVVATPILEQVSRRLEALLQLGLSYLELDRVATSLSGGEVQRIRLATQIGSALVGVTYILDEPSIGLHSRDHRRLLEMLRRLRDLGNSVLVVEHDPEAMLAADYLVELGPGAGAEGGRLIARGTPDQFLATEGSLTADYLSGRRGIEVPAKRRRPRRTLELLGARGHNLRGVDLKLPIGALTCVTGVSGSGKSSLVLDTLLPEARRRLAKGTRAGLPHDGVRGLQHFERVVAVDQAPIGRSARSNPATYTGIFGELRTLFAGLPDARIRGFDASRFSFNVKGGRCEACQGEGVRRVEMHFLPDVFVTCRTCEGRRYNRDTLAIEYRGKSVADVLEMSVSEAHELFANVPGIRGRLEILRDVGLGYVTLGQSATTLSGGEAQRIKLSRELARKSGGATLFILDEPTTGLHLDDVRVLLAVLQRLVDEGHTVVVIEHHLDVIKCADFVIDVGPEGGRGGGMIVASGTPEQVALQGKGATAPFLARALGMD